MNIWGYLQEYKIIHMLFLFLLYLGTIPINKMLQMPEKEQINIQDNSPKENIKTQVSTEIIIQKNTKAPEIIVNDSQIKNNFLPENLNPENIIDATKNVITINVKQSTQDLVKLLDETIAAGGGKLKIFKGLKCQNLSKKKINETANQLEKIINETIVKLETKNTKKNLLIKEKTNKFVAKTKKRVFDMHKNMSTEMRKSIGQNPQVVTNNTCVAKKQIAEFENKIITKISKFSDKLKQDIKREVI